MQLLSRMIRKYHFHYDMENKILIDVAIDLRKRGEVPPTVGH